MDLFFLVGLFCLGVILLVVVLLGFLYCADDPMEKSLR